MHGAEGNYPTGRDPAAGASVSSVPDPAATPRVSTVHVSGSAKNTYGGHDPGAAGNAVFTGLVPVAPRACWALYNVQRREPL